MESTKSTHKHEILSEGNIFLLFKDGALAICPFPPPFLQPSQLAGGKPEMRRFPCSTQCPMADIHTDEKDENMFYVTTCGCKEQKRSVTPKSELVTADGVPATTEKPVVNPLIT